MYTRLENMFVSPRAGLFAVVAAAAFATGCDSTATAESEADANATQSPSVLSERQSGVTRIDLHSRELAFEGREFGAAGQYEWLDGELFLEIDPADPRNQVIVNLDKAPRNADGRVEYSAEFRMLKPVDMRRGNGTLFYDVMNRGAQRAFNLAQDYLAGYGVFARTPEEFGDGFHLELGYTMVWSGWQASATGDRIGAVLPVAKNADGSPVTAWRTTEIRGNSTTTAIEARLYPTVEASMPEAKLFRRVTPHAEPVLLARDSWSFARCEAGSEPVPSPVDLCLEGGFSADAIYYLVHEVQDTIVMGIGFAAVRDAVSFFRYDATNANPLVARPSDDGDSANPITTALVWGQSQPGRFIRDFIYQGFNQDPAGQRVFDGAFVVTAGARKTFTNYEFANPGRFVRSVDDHYYPGDQFPFTYATMLDPVTGRVDGILARCSLTETCPRIMHFDSANELWAARASLVTTDPLGRVDVPIPDNVRVYQWASTQHNQAGFTGYETLAELEAKREADMCEYLPNNAMVRENRRALVVAMQEWVTTDREPPPSQYARVADGTLVAPSERMFPAIPGVSSSGRANELFVNDYRAHPAKHTTAGYTVLVPQVDADGNDVAGIRSPAIAVPLGTHVGWNHRRAGRVTGESCGTRGSFFPFASSQEERGDDPRLSLEERYGTHEGYVDRVREAVEQLRDARLLLDSDAARLIRNAETRDTGLPAS